MRIHEIDPERVEEEPIIVRKTDLVIQMRGRPYPDDTWLLHVHNSVYANAP
jgi:hypothetical protein